jgi:hypothetical protein
MRRTNAGKPDALAQSPSKGLRISSAARCLSKGSGQFHASSANTLPDVRAGYNNDSAGCCAKAVGSGNMLWTIEDNLAEMFDGHV